MSHARTLVRRTTAAVRTGNAEHASSQGAKQIYSETKREEAKVGEQQYVAPLTPRNLKGARKGKAW